MGSRVPDPQHRIIHCFHPPAVDLTDLVVEVPEAEDGLLLDLAEDGEEGRLHSVAVQRVLPGLSNCNSKC
jgi:hypothetical protein